MTDKNYYMKKVNELKKHILPTSSVLIVTHDFPDPDCIAAAFGMQQLLSHWGVKTTQITFGGFVGRAENRAMLRFLNIQTVPLMLIEFSDFERIILIDSFPGSGNVSLKLEHPVDVVLDHHPHKPPQDTTFYYDIRDDLGSTSTIVTQYLIAEQCNITSQVATALFYGIKKDTNHLARNVSTEDLECYKFLFDLIDHYALSCIELPDRDTEYFRVLHRSVESMTFFNDTIGYTHLGVVETPDYIAEIADLFHSLENLEWMLCTAIFKNQIFFSIRSKDKETAGINAEKIAKRLNGYGGGHSRKAAGKIPVKDTSLNNALERFISTFKTILNVKDITGQAILK